MLLPPARPFGSADVYIDDIIVVFLDSTEDSKRASLAIRSPRHPPNRPPTVSRRALPCEPLISISKPAAEGSPSETKLDMRMASRPSAPHHQPPTRKSVSLSLDIDIDKPDIKLLRLWQSFLHQAQSGIRLSLLTTRRPTNIIHTDACPHGLGGFSVSSCRAWRFYIRQRSIPDNNN
jgi:hypothetical protein